MIVESQLGPFHYDISIVVSGWSDTEMANTLKTNYVTPRIIQDEDISVPGNLFAIVQFNILKRDQIMMLLYV